MSIMRKFVEFWPEFAARLTARADREPIATLADLHRFIATRSAFVAQKTLYGYLKTRMGTRYPTVFEDDQMIASINIAKMHVYEACVADLTIFCITRATDENGFADEMRQAMSIEAYDTAITENIDGTFSDAQLADWRDSFVSRLGQTDWQRAAGDAEYRLASPGTLLEWAPIAPELKKFDVEVVRNSVRFAWHEVRAQFRARCDKQAVIRSLKTQQP